MATTIKHTHRVVFGQLVHDCPACIAKNGGVNPPAPVEKPAEPVATKHTCCAPGRGPGFRRTPGCPRCAELDAGAERRHPDHVEEFGRHARLEEERSAAIKAHFAPGGVHDRGECGPVCVAFDW